MVTERGDDEYQLWKFNDKGDGTYQIQVDREGNPE